MTAPKSLLVGFAAGILLTVATLLAITTLKRESQGNKQPEDHSAHTPSATQHENHGRSAVMLDAAQQAVAGIRLEVAQEESISEPLRAVATVVADESRIVRLHARIPGWIEELPAGTEGQPIRKGDAVARIYSQELFSTQAEYLATLAESSTQPASTLAGSARKRLLLLGMGETELRRIEQNRKPERLVTLTAPISGTILRRAVAAGSAIDPSTEILTIADLSRLWVWAELPGSMAGKIVRGTPAQLEFPGSSKAAISAKVDFIAPTLAEGSRSVQVRFTVANQSDLLRPGLTGTATFRTTSRQAVLVSRDAVVDTGLGQHLFIAHEGGHFEPRTIRTGARSGKKIEIVEGLAAGEMIAASGVFLLDSESRLQASGGTGGAHSGHGASNVQEGHQHD